MEPAKSIIAKLGGEEEVARITGRNITSPYRWQRAIDKEGTGGRIPEKHIQVLLAAAKARNVELTIVDFFPEASPAEAAA